MNAEDIWRAVDAEKDSLQGLLAQLSEVQWSRPSLCDRWQVRDVVAHIVLSARATPSQLALGLIRARGDINRMACETATRHAGGRTDFQLLDELRSTVGSRFTPFGTTPADRLMDLLVHGQDIAIPLGIHHAMPPAAAQLAIERIWTARFPFRATTRLTGLRLHAVDTGWTAGDGLPIEAPVSALLLLATGRAVAALPQLRGDGVELVRARQAR
ncbi:maleylpyruvate isomerase family mycothiol-dependent enzyme [Mycobacterium sp. HM-7]